MNATPALNNLAVCRSQFAEAGERAQAAHDVHSALLVRKTEAEARVNEAISDARSGKLDEETAALRMSIASADAADIQALIDQSAPVLAALDAALVQAQTRCTEAERGAQREEDQIATAALDNRIKELEAMFLGAVAERFRLHMRLQGNRGSLSTFNFYQPTPAMQELIKGNVPPKV